MDIHKPILKAGSKIALAAMGVLFVLGMICYKERVLFADASFVVFHIINEKRLCIQEQRYGSFVTQIFPYLGQKIHLSLSAIVFLYGISFNLFYFVVNAALVYIFKQYRLAILMALYYFLFFSQSFIWVSEIPQGIAWMFLLFGTTTYLRNKKVPVVLISIPFLFFSMLALFSHFVIIVPFIFLWVYLMIEQQEWPMTRKSYFLFSSLILLVIGVKFLASGGQHGAEGSLLHGVTHCSIKDVINSFRTSVVKTFIRRCISNYWLSAIILIAGTTRLVRNKKKILAAWTIISALGYVIVMGLTYGNSNYDAHLFHIESEWTSLGILFAAPFVFEFLPRVKSWNAGWMLAGIFIIRLIYIICFLPPFSQRNEVKEEILGEMRHKGITKLALISDAHLKTAMILDWALPYESILMSELDGDKQQLTFLFVNATDTQTIDQLKHPTGFYDVWGVLPWGIMNKAYYNLDSINVYRVMTYDEFMK